MQMQLYALHVVPFIVIVYLAFLLFIRAPKAVVLASLLGGLTMGLVNALGDLVAYYLHLWHYTIDGLTFHLPLLFYITPILVYGGIAYLLIWRFQHGRRNWLAWLLLIGVPILGFARDFLGSAITHETYLTWDGSLAGPLDFLLWIFMFYAGFLVFRRLVTRREETVIVK